MTRLVTLATTLFLAAAPARPPSVATRVVAPLADPAVVPGIARCTSDGACTVTDEAGTRAATPLAEVP